MMKYHYVDFAANFQKGFRNHVVSITEVPKLTDRYGRYGCYATYFFYSDEILTHMVAHADEGRPSVSGYAGKVWAPYFLIDVDHPQLEVAAQTVKYLARHLLDDWRIDSRGFQIYFSGMKGFHLMLNVHAFGKMAPSKILPQLFAAMRRHLVEFLPDELRGAVDMGISDRVRLIRLPNTLHEKSHLYKILLSHDEIMNFNRDRILKAAEKSRPLCQTDPTGFISLQAIDVSPAARDFMKRILRQLKKITHPAQFEYRLNRPSNLTRVEFPCLGMQRIWESHIEPGLRNNCAIRLASNLRMLGYAQNETREHLLEWNHQNAIGLPEREILSVLQSAYQRPFPYHYGCHDEILKHYCPHRKYEWCQQHVAEQTEKIFRTSKEPGDHEA